MDDPLLNITPGDQNGQDTDLIKDATLESFQQDVLEASKQTPVLVDFWAPWCGPCKQLTPLLEKAVKAAKGAVKLVKINIDENQALAGQLRVQSVPTVYAFADGQPVDGFAGALPESELKAFIEKVSGGSAGPDLEAVIEQAMQALDKGEAQLASEMLVQILTQEPDNIKALAGLVKCYIKVDQLDMAENTLAMIPEDKAQDSLVQSAIAALELAKKSGEAGDLDDLQQKVRTNPEDLEGRYDLAIALHAKGDKEGASAQLIEIVSRNRDWQEGKARSQLLEFFEAWGPTEPATLDGRRQLSSLLFS